MVASNIAENKEKLMHSFITNRQRKSIAFARALLNMQRRPLSPLQIVENIAGTIQFVAADICPPQVRHPQIIAGNGKTTPTKDIDYILTSLLQIRLVFMFLCLFYKTFEFSTSDNTNFL